MKLKQFIAKAMLAGGSSELFPYQQLIIELAGRSRLPGMYP